MNKKAQLKIQEMSFMLVAVVIFFVIAFLFFVSVKYKEISQSATSSAKEKTLSSVMKLADTAEFSCGKPLCVDADKLIVMKNRKSYDSFWPVLTSISVVKVFPSENNTLVECTKINYPNCNFFKIYDKKGSNEEKLATYVSICRKEIKDNYVYDKCELGKIMAGFEPKS